MKVWPVIAISPILCECDTQCACGSDDKEIYKIFSTFKKAEKFVEAQPKGWKGATYYECGKTGIEVE